MVKKLVLVFMLLGAGVAIALYLSGDRTTTEALPAFKPQSGATPEVRIADLERALAAQIERARAQDARISQLEARLQGPGQGRRGGDDEGRPSEEQMAQMRERFGLEMGADGRPDPAAMRERARERQLQRFVEAGFTRDRAEWIERRTEELEVQAMQAQYEAQRSGRPTQGPNDVQRALRNEIGDAEYERYLNATGQPTEVQIMDVLASSAAERSGLQAGDQVVSYGGTRVFDMRELNSLTREGSPGETVTVEVRRNGQTVQVQVPRGPLGVSGGGVRRGGGGGPPGRQGGGFRGGGGGAN